MKSRFLFFCIGMLVSASLAAQDDQFGLKCGLNLARFSLSEVEVLNVKPLPSYHVGLFFRNNFQKLSVQTEIMYSSLATKVFSSSNLKLNYLSIPLTFKAQVISKLSLQVGLQANTLIAEKEGFSEIRIQGFDFSLTGGCGWDFSNRLFLDCRYNLGLNAITKLDNSEGSISAQKSRVLSVSLGWNFLK